MVCAGCVFVAGIHVRIFWIRVMKCMCAQTRPRFILSSEGVLGGMEFETMLTPREKSPLLENIPRGGSNPRCCGQRAQALPTELFRPLYGIWYCVRKWHPQPGTHQYTYLIHHEKMTYTTWYTQVHMFDTTWENDTHSLVHTSKYIWHIMTKWHNTLHTSIYMKPYEKTTPTNCFYTRTYTWHPLKKSTPNTHIYT